MAHHSNTPARRRGGFQPPHCPNPECAFHKLRAHWRFKRAGFFVRPSDKRPIQTFQCLHCGRKFSTRTFSATYWLRRRDLYPRIASMICEGPALRQIARILCVSHATIGRHVARLGRHGLLFHHDLMQQIQIHEPLVVDGFETFEYSQYFPFHINFAAGSDSWFLYHFTDAPLRRKGRMTPHQKRRRTELEHLYARPDPKAVERSMAELVRPLLGMIPHKAFVLHSDDHKAYPRALKRLREEEPDGPKIDHRITPSTERRTKKNPLFPVNLIDLLARHSSANHRRETIAFSKSRQSAMERTAILTVWRNCVKRRSENGPRQSAAMYVGLLDRLLTWREVLRRRWFPHHAQLPKEWADYYWKRVKTVVLQDRQTEHTCLYAF